MTPLCYNLNRQKVGKMKNEKEKDELKTEQEKDEQEKRDPGRFGLSDEEAAQMERDLLGEADG